MDSNITTSVTPKKLNFMNIKEVTPKAQTNEVLSAIGWEFMRTHALTLKDGGIDLANQQKGFQMINPTDKWFPGLTEIRENFETWDWNYGKTPKFTINRTFPVPEHLLTNYEGNCLDLCITLKVEHGRINDVTLFVPPGLTSSGFSGEAKVITSLKGQKFSEDAMTSLEWYLGVGENSYSDDRDKFVTECFRQVMTSV